MVHDRGFADQIRAEAASLLELLVLPLQFRGFEGARGHEHEAIGLEGLFDVVIGAALDRGHGGLDVAVAADDDDGQLRVRLFDPGQHFEAVELRSLQPDVENHEGGPPLLDRAQGLVAVLGEPRLVPFVLENAGDEFPNVRFVVDNKNVRRHGSIPPYRD
jgi:hypothetical protein